MKAWLLLGSNLGDRLAFLSSAQTLIEENIGPIINISGIYETDPWGNKEQDAFLNQVLVVDMELGPEELLKILQTIEDQVGRERGKEKWKPREIDIDILLIDDQIVRLPALEIPHPELANRRFTLVPLHELAPELVHPVRKTTVSALLEVCTDEAAVMPFRSK